MIEQTHWSESSGGEVHPPAHRRPQGPEAPQDSGPGPHTVFLISEDPPHLLSMFEWLSAAGYTTEATSDASRGLSYVRKHRPEVVLAGLDLGSMADLEVLDGIHAASPETQVIVVSDRVDWEVHELAHRHRASALISRAAGARVVLTLIKNVLDRKS